MLDVGCWVLEDDVGAVKTKSPSESAANGPTAKQSERSKSYASKKQAV